ncbi:MAG: flagellin FliC5 [Ruminococcus sp.]|nr:flagellin FliC5 [Ruminococcus sp.]MBR1476381.1 flagellin FliC5 [Lachnospiraceae bacterium]
MSGVSGINSSYSAYSNYSAALSSGKKINSAADGASELAILEKEDRQVRGTDAGTENMQDAKSAINIADGALDGITDQLQRMRELGIKAMNGLLTDDDRQYIQNEIDQLKQGIADVAKNATFNEKHLLDGSEENFNIMSDANGTTRNMANVNGTLEALGIADFDVTSGNFDLGAIDNALKTVSQGRSTLGAQSNAFDHAISYNNIVSYNTVASQSRMGDTEYGEYVSKLQKENILNTYQVMMQKKRMEDEQTKAHNIFS